MLETICETMKRAYDLNWITSRDGNVSIRYQDRDHFYVTPSGVRKQTLQPDQFKKIGLTTKLSAVPPFMTTTWQVLAYTPISEGLEPTGELPLHFELQKEITGETRVVLHVHPPYTLAAMYRGILLDQLALEFPEIHRYTSVAPTVGPVAPLSEALAQACVGSLGLNTGSLKHDIVGIDRHGVVAVATTPWRAFEHVERLEHVCKIVLAGS